MKRFRQSRHCSSCARALLSIAFLVSFFIGSQAQSSLDPTKSVEALQSRIERARALVAAHQLETSASELESVRAATADDTIRNITSVMLMSIYLEEGNYARAQALLEENFGSRAIRGDDSIRGYFALAGQAVNGARTHLARYRSFGVNTSDSSLPVEALNDLNRLRSLLERMIAQAKEISGLRNASDSLSLLEDVLGIRLSLAKDVEDQTKWESEYARVREALASSQTQIPSLGGALNLAPAKPSLATTSTTSSAKPIPIADAFEKTTTAAVDKQLPANQHATDSVSAGKPKAETAIPARVQTNKEKAADAKLVDTGSLNEKATKRVLPRYPPLAKQRGSAGFVRVHVIVDETGKVVAVSHSEGPILLRQAAEEAARQWAFQAISSEGKPARFSGFIDFKFTL